MVSIVNFYVWFSGQELTFLPHCSVLPKYLSISPFKPQVKPLFFVLLFRFLQPPLILHYAAPRLQRSPSGGKGSSLPNLRGLAAPASSSVRKVSQRGPPAKISVTLSFSHFLFFSPVPVSLSGEQFVPSLGAQPLCLYSSGVALRAGGDPWPHFAWLFLILFPAVSPTRVVKLTTDLGHLGSWDW